MRLASLEVSVSILLSKKVCFQPFLWWLDTTDIIRLERLLTDHLELSMLCSNTTIQLDSSHCSSCLYLPIIFLHLVIKKRGNQEMLLIVKNGLIVIHNQEYMELWHSCSNSPLSVINTTCCYHKSYSGRKLELCTTFAAIIRTSKHFWLLQCIWHQTRVTYPWCITLCSHWNHCIWSQEFWDHKFLVLENGLIFYRFMVEWFFLLHKMTIKGLIAII